MRISHTSKGSQAEVLRPFDVRRWQEAAPCFLPSPPLLPLFFIPRWSWKQQQQLSQQWTFAIHCWRASSASLEPLQHGQANKPLPLCFSSAWLPFPMPEPPSKALCTSLSPSSAAPSSLCLPSPPLLLPSASWAGCPARIRRGWLCTAPAQPAWDHRAGSSQLHPFCLGRLHSFSLDCL